MLNDLPHPTIDPMWFTWLDATVRAPFFSDLIARVHAASIEGPVYPPEPWRYSALMVPPEQVKVVILGQDPYHGPGQAHGLAFSVPPGVRIPPSLANIYAELEREGFGPASGRDGCLLPWAQQGVLLLNTVLSVNQGQPQSHKNWGWETFTDAIVQALNERREGLVFLLWGKDAAAKAQHVDATRHGLFRAPHPSPFSAYKGFFGCDHFRRANAYLMERGVDPIVW